MIARKFTVLIGAQTVADPEVPYVSWVRANQLFRLAEVAGHDPYIEEVPAELVKARIDAAMEVKP